MIYGYNEQYKIPRQNLCIFFVKTFVYSKFGYDEYSDITNLFFIPVDDSKNHFDNEVDSSLVNSALCKTRVKILSYNCKKSF